MSVKSHSLEGWPYACQACGGWCLPAAEMLGETDPHERGRLLAEAFVHSSGKGATNDVDRRTT